MNQLQPKYRLLQEDELKELETEFVHFLVVNGIVAEDWEKMKKEDPENANKMLLLFSDVALEGSLRKIEYVEHRVKNKLHIIRCFEDKMVLIGISSDNDSVDFMNPDNLQKSMDNPTKGVEVYTSEKKYEVTREMDIFKMTQSGFLISDGRLFKKLCLFL
ncbi:MAG: hypothetical protein ACI8XB_002659 [Patiriisocius sp.]|jgi:hypothetical protein